MRIFECLTINFAKYQISTDFEAFENCLAAKFGHNSLRMWALLRSHDRSESDEWFIFELIRCWWKCMSYGTSVEQAQVCQIRKHCLMIYIGWADLPAKVNGRICIKFCCHFHAQASFLSLRPFILLANTLKTVRLWWNKDFGTILHLCSCSTEAKRCWVQRFI